MSVILKFQFEAKFLINFEAIFSKIEILQPRYIAQGWYARNSNLGNIPLI